MYPVYSMVLCIAMPGMELTFSGGILRRVGSGNRVFLGIEVSDISDNLLNSIIYMKDALHAHTAKIL